MSDPFDMFSYILNDVSKALKYIKLIARYQNDLS